MSVVVRLEEKGLRPEQELAALIAQASGDGAVVSFAGIARPGCEEYSIVTSDAFLTRLP